MGLFNNFDRPGHGVRKDAERSKGFKLFNELLFRKIGSYITLNFFYMTSLVPSIALIWYISMTILNDFTQLGNDTFVAAALLSIIFSTVICVVFGLSPFSSGFYYVLRNFSFEKHAFVLSDFIDKFKENKKNSWIMFFIDLISVAATMLLLRLYLILSISNSILIAPMMILLIMFVAFALMTPYKWTMLVTFDLGKKDIYKNALFMVLGNTKVSILQFLSSALVIFVFFALVYLVPVAGIILFFLIFSSVLGLVYQLNIYTPMQDLISQSRGGHENIN